MKCVTIKAVEPEKPPAEFPELLPILAILGAVGVAYYIYTNR